MSISLDKAPKDRTPEERDALWRSISEYSKGGGEVTKPAVVIDVPALTKTTDDFAAVIEGFVFDDRLDVGHIEMVIDEEIV